MFAVGDVEGDTNNAEQLAFAAVKRLDVRFEDQLLPFEFVGDGFAGQSLAVSGDRSKFRIVGLEIFEEAFTGHLGGMRAEFFRPAPMPEVKRRSLSGVQRTAGIFSIMTLSRVRPSWRSI